jgi:hypothetical protein
MDQSVVMIQIAHDAFPHDRVMHTQRGCLALRLSPGTLKPFLAMYWRPLAPQRGRWAVAHLTPKRWHDLHSSYAVVACFLVLLAVFFVVLAFSSFSFKALDFSSHGLIVWAISRLLAVVALADKD